jgi:cobalamin biosynthesis Mg chelatase CobN
MPDPIEKAKDVAESAAHPVETTKDLAEEAERGRSARTPAIAITGVSLVVAVIVAVLLAVTLTLYFVYGGR